MMPQADAAQVEQQSVRFLQDVFAAVPALPAGQARRQPARVTLTFAQSVDAKIAGAGGKQVAISGKESLIMTHVMRTMHDHIMVGIGTMTNDNPQLNARQLCTPPAVERLPRPTVLDPRAQTHPQSKVLLNAAGGTGRSPLIICEASADAERVGALRSAGASVVQLGEGITTKDWAQVLSTLQSAGAESIMIEGGAKVISSLLSAHVQGTVQVDALIVTVGTTMLGPEAVGYEGSSLSSFRHYCTEQFGHDTVIAWVRERRD